MLFFNVFDVFLLFFNRQTCFYTKRHTFNNFLTYVQTSLLCPLRSMSSRTQLRRRQRIKHHAQPFRYQNCQIRMY